MKVKVGTVPKSNRKIIERGKMDTSKTTNTHFPGLVQALYNKKWQG
jgi:hypothetical protein